MGVEDVIFRYVTLRSIAEGRCYLLVTTCTVKLLMKAKRVVMIPTNVCDNVYAQLVKNCIFVSRLIHIINYYC